LVDNDDDIDSIPIVALSLDFAAPSQHRAPPPPREPTPPPVFVDVDGELPDGPLRAPAVVEQPAVAQAVEERSEEIVRDVEAVEGLAVRVVKKKKPKAGGAAAGEGEAKEKKKAKKKAKQVELE